MNENKPVSFVTALKLGALVIGVLGFVGAWAIIPYRVEQSEKVITANHALVWKAISEIRDKREIDHEILVRIDERLKRLDPLPVANK